jgi:nitroimidazol reductase NimA-like FMN-containing flavoprotein (pyridoxamine 5'-phosphate oxidase superfamily)
MPAQFARGWTLEFRRAEERFLRDNEVARLATVGPDGLPHVVPVCFIYSSGAFWVATDYGTRKFGNLQRNRKVALLVDVGQYSNRGVLIQGKARIFKKGSEFRGIYKVFFKKFDWVRADPWMEGEAPFIRIEPSWKVSWGLRG